MPSQRKSAAQWYIRFGVSDFVVLLHLPFSSIVMSFIIIGASMSGTLYLDRLAISMLAVFCALQGSHFLDEIKGHHWGTRLSTKRLLLTGFTLLSIGVVMGIYLALTVNAALFLFMLPLVFFPVAYNLELWNAKFHNPLWFGVSWGALVYLGSFFLQSAYITAFSVLMAMAIGVQSASILVLYENTKKKETRVLSWRVLKGTVILWNLIALAMLLEKLS